MSYKINLGGGNTKIEGFTNLDFLALPNVDIVCDLSKGIPLQDNSVEEIYTSHFLEHIDNTVKLMEEIWRVCKPNAIIKIKCPYFKSIGAFQDPTHQSFFTERTFEYFDPEKLKQGILPDYHIKAQFRTEKIAYVWSNKWIRFLPFKKFFAHHFWNIARSIYYELRVIK